MATRVNFDFSRPATLGAVLSGAGVFNGTTELGRARATVGAANAASQLAATCLGDYANGGTYSVSAARGTEEMVVRDGKHVRATPRTAGTALQLVTALNTTPRDPRVDPSAQEQLTNRDATRRALGVEYRADLAGGTGGDPAGTGTATFAGGLVPSSQRGNFYEFSSTSNGGLFVFDDIEPLELQQVVGVFSGSIAWSLTLRKLTEARSDQAIASAVTGATATSVTLLNTPVIIYPGWGLGMTANAQGRVYVTVKRVF